MKKQKPEADPVTLRVGQRLKSHRVRLRLTLADVEAATGIDRSNVARYERGEGETSFRRLEVLAQHYGVSLADLFSR
jgi:transcriptional regulator with XRE-family HTH domain